MSYSKINPEVYESEARKSHAIVTAINTLYCPGVNSKNPDILALYKFEQGKDGKTKIGDMMMLYMDPKKTYDQNIATINGIKMQKQMGLPVDQYRPQELQAFAEDFISKMPEGRFKQEALEVWLSNVESLKTLAEKNPDSTSLATAVQTLERGKNRRNINVQENVSEF